MNKILEPKSKPENITIKAPDIRTIEFEVVGTAPLVMHKFGRKTQEQMQATQEAGSTAVGKKKRDAKDFNAKYQESMHVSTEGWVGIPAAAFRSSMISACRLVGFQMTKAKMSVFVLGDGLGSDDGRPLIKLRGKPEMHVAPARNDNGSIDLRSRAMFREWGCKIRVQYDADQFTSQDVANLLLRAGMQVGVLEGRPDSKQSHGMGWGTFTIKGV